MRYKQKIQQSYITKRMKTNVLAIILSGAVATLAISDAMAQTQNSRSTYFLEGSTYRHELNPAFMGERGYVSLPGLGNLTIGAQSTGGVGDFIFKKANGDLTTFMNEEVSSAEFLKGLPKRLKVGVNVDESILSLGFHAWGGFNTLGISVKSNTNFFMPDELFKFMKNGVASETGSSYNVKNLNIISTNYAEIAFGHAREINERLTVGAKVKALVGLAKATMHIDELNILASQDKWTITPKNAELYMSAKGLIVPTKGETGNYQEDDYILDANGDRTQTLKEGTDGQISYDDLDFDTDNLGPTGFGMAIDLGATYKLNDEWTFSASLLDLGFISWKNTTKGTMSKDFTFDGFSEISVKDDGSNNNKKLDTQVDELVDDLADLAKFDKVGEGMKRTTALAATLHLGAQYTLPAYDRLNFGFLSTTRMQGKHSWTEARVSANVAPLSWFEASVNYALSNFGSDAGIMLNFHPRGFNFFIGADVPMCKYEPAYYAPISRAAVNMNLGINFTFGPKHKRKYKTVETQSL